MNTPSNLLVLAQMEMDTSDPKERQKRIEAAAEALRNGIQVKGKVDGEIVVISPKTKAK